MIRFVDARCLRCGIEFQHDADRGEDYCSQCDLMFTLREILSHLRGEY